MDTNTTPRIERLTREALGGPCVPPKTQPQPEIDEDYAKWERIRRVVSTVILSAVLMGLWTLGIFAAIRPIA
ncbi:MAG TPA: hypothetical protein VFK48_11500 [Usitatibacter sp.]|nr:hypothetical protein [Usitatibacter sp.]